MKTLTISAFLSSLALCATLATAQDITPTRVGPVSQYGQLMTGKNSQGQGRIYGSCEGVKDGAEVQVRGMSLYWSLMPQAVDFWSEEGITSMVNDMKIQIVRAAMATGDENWKGEWNGIQLKGYASDPNNQKQFVKTVVEAAIKNDIYVIIDWHSHTAHQQTDASKNFFKEMAEAYGQYNNVIFEIYNEPQKIEWDLIKSYADEVVAEIRKYSDNLVLVGTPEWDQYPNRVIGKEVNDPKQNTAYTFHYYSGTHCISGMHPGNEFWACEGEHAIEAMNAGLSVFVSEWGTTTADGKGDVAGDNDGWQNWLNSNKLSWANWSASKISEGSAAFSNQATTTNLAFSNSGNKVKSYLATNPEQYSKCGSGNGENSGDNNGSENGNNNENTPVFLKTDLGFNVTFTENALHIAGGNATVEIYSIKGDKLIKVDNVSGTLSLASLPVGKYFTRIQMGSSKIVRTIQIK